MLRFEPKRSRSYARQERGNCGMPHTTVRSQTSRRSSHIPFGASQRSFDLLDHSHVRVQAKLTRAVARPTKVQELLRTKYATSSTCHCEDQRETRAFRSTHRSTASQDGDVFARLTFALLGRLIENDLNRLAPSHSRGARLATPTK